ncbi:hypothetical protein BXY66_3863 [Shimia isoporae]|uniref:Transposase n=1 Tax=Shimia isoporae TaxID=647720 RepID=A0A4R1N2H1_9RHOB|nr:hypothetical protein [Shimia isoporae]TCK99361.1 hypothetical protein BXY66_3863 [Shimia isoporae]
MATQEQIEEYAALKAENLTLKAQLAYEDRKLHVAKAERWAEVFEEALTCAPPLPSQQRRTEREIFAATVEH